MPVRQAEMLIRLTRFDTRESSKHPSGSVQINCPNFATRIPTEGPKGPLGRQYVL